MSGGNDPNDETSQSLETYLSSILLRDFSKKAKKNSTGTTQLTVRKSKRNRKVTQRLVDSAYLEETPAIEQQKKKRSND